jgi:hypothetical protein
VYVSGSTSSVAICVAVAVAPAGRYAEAHQPVARLQQCPQHGDIGDGRRQRLDVGVLRPENPLGTLNGKASRSIASMVAPPLNDTRGG